METRFFTSDNIVYTQTKGVPIGGTISGLLAELVLQEGENRILANNITNLVSYFRYVDDALVIWKNSTNTQTGKEEETQQDKENNDENNEEIQNEGNDNRQEAHRNDKNEDNNQGARNNLETTTDITGEEDYPTAGEIEEESYPTAEDDQNQGSTNPNTNPIQTKSKRRRRRARWGIKKRIILGDHTLDTNTVDTEEVIAPIETPRSLMDAMIKKDENLTYKMEGSGKLVNYLDLKLTVGDEELQIYIYRKDTHLWDLPRWKSRTPQPIKKQQSSRLY